VTAHIDYSELDRPDDPIQSASGGSLVILRLRPTITRLAGSRRNRLFAHGPALHRPGRALRACRWNMMIPYLCPHLPQKAEGGAELPGKVRSSTRMWRLRIGGRLSRWGSTESLVRGSYHSSVRLNPVTNIGAYRAPRSPDEPIAHPNGATPCQPGLSELDQHRSGGYELLRDGVCDLRGKDPRPAGRMLGPAGFHAAR